jgi:hypothetical protein
MTLESSANIFWQGFYSGTEVIFTYILRIIKDIPCFMVLDFQRNSELYYIILLPPLLMDDIKSTWLYNITAI